MHPEQSVARIKALYEAHGHNHYGEAMSQIQHAVQSGRLAQADGQPDVVVLGAFLHDIGHLLVHEVPEAQRNDAIYRHQRIGAQLLRELGFAEQVADLVERHVDGKRYLTAVDPAYKAGLSLASVESLAFQGGPMNEAEVAAFEALPDHDLHIRLREWDDLAKDPDDTDVEMTPFLDMARRHLDARSAG